MSIYDDAEKSLITKIVNKEESLLKAIDKGIVPDVFLQQENRDLYDLLKKFFIKYRRVPNTQELVLFSSSDTTISKEQKEKSPLYFQELLANDTPIDASDDLLIDSLVSVYKANKAKQIALTLAKDGAEEKIDSTIDKMIAGYTKLKNIGTSGELVVDYKEDAADRLARYEKVKLKQQDTGLYYCFPTLNRITGGQDRQTLWVVRGGPKAGKSTALINMSNHVAKQGKNVIYFSAEVSKDVIERRLDAINLSIPMSAIKRGTLTEDEERAFRDYTTNPDPKRGSIIIIDKSNITTESIRAQVRDIRNKMPIHLIVVDYLGLIKLSYKAESKWIEIGEVAKELRAIAKEEDLPVLTAQQTNKQGDTANAQEIDRTCDLLFDISRENPDEDAIEGGNVDVTAKIVFSRDSGLGTFPIEAQFAYSLMKEVQTDYMM